MERSAVGTVNPAQAVQRRRRDAMIRASGLALLTALAAAAFGQGAFFSTVQWFAVALIALAFAVALGARVLPVADLRSGFVLAGLLLAVWALIRAAAGGRRARAWLGAVRRRNGCGRVGEPSAGRRLA